MASETASLSERDSLGAKDGDGKLSPDGDGHDDHSKVRRTTPLCRPRKHSTAHCTSQPPASQPGWLPALQVSHINVNKLQDRLAYEEESRGAVCAALTFFVFTSIYIIVLDMQVCCNRCVSCCTRARAHALTAPASARSSKRATRSKSHKP